MNRLTFNVNASDLGDEGKLLGVLERWRPSAVFVMNALSPNPPAENIVIRLQKLLRQWGGIVVYRPFEDKIEGELWKHRSPRDHVNILLNFGVKDIWYNVGNEPKPNDKDDALRMSAWYADFAHQAVSEGLRVVIPGGFGTGTFELGQIQDGWFDDMLLALVDLAGRRVDGFSQVMFGTHEYAHAVIPWHAAGRDVTKLTDSPSLQPQNWPTRQEVFDTNQSDNWLILRFNWLLDRAAELARARGITPPIIDVAVTECNLDRMPNIVDKFQDLVHQIDQMAGKEVRGIPTLLEYWKKVFPQWSPAEALAQQCLWMERVYPANYRFFALFTWSWHTDWRENYNVGEFDDFLQRWPEFAQTIASSHSSIIPLDQPNVDKAAFVVDVTVEDGTVLQPAQDFEKVWRLRNVGTTIWDTGYRFTFLEGNPMGALNKVSLLRRVRPGETIDIALNLTAPSEVGLYKGIWKLQNAQGEFFNTKVWVSIAVQGENIPQPDNGSGVVENAAVTPLDNLHFEDDITIPDGTTVKPGQPFEKIWRVRNTGTTAWGNGYTFSFLRDNRMSGSERRLTPAQPGELVNLSLQLTAPPLSGRYFSTWKARNPQGEFFGSPVFALINVVDPDRTFDMRDFMRGDGRLYILQHNSELGGGQERVQTQRDTDGVKEYFYHAKNHEWEELWADEHFIFRGTDTSPGDGKIYTLFEPSQYGSPWIPRHMSIGVPFKRSPRVVFRRKDNGMITDDGMQATWIRLERVHQTFRTANGIDVQNVAELAAYLGPPGQPGTPPAFEHYFYGKKYGLVEWHGDDHKISSLAQELMGESDNEREIISWLRREPV